MWKRIKRYSFFLPCLRHTLYSEGTVLRQKKLKVIIPVALVAGALLISSPVWVSGIADAVSSGQEAG